jgi:DNA-binding LacI/PurR family transcriptional regulator
MTVSKALREEPDVSADTKTRIKLLAQQLGYVPDSSAQGLRTRTSKLFGVAVPSSADPMFSRVVLAIEQSAYEMGYDILLAHTLDILEREEACIRRFLSRRVDGLFIAPVCRLSNDARIYGEIVARSIPTVILGRPPEFCNQFPVVESDDVVASHTVTDHLLKLGHQRIVFLAGPTAAPWAQERFEGYRRSLRAAGIDLNEKLVFQAGRTIEDGARATAQILKEHSRATAIQAVSDPVAIGAAQVLLDHGLSIPQDVSIAGFGNIALSDWLRVPLTTVNQPKHRLGMAAVLAMRQLLQNKRPETRPLPAELLVRGSTGTAPAVSRL